MYNQGILIQEKQKTSSVEDSKELKEYLETLWREILNATKDLRDRFLDEYKKSPMNVVGAAIEDIQAMAKPPEDWASVYPIFRKLLQGEPAVYQEVLLKP